MIHKGHTAIMTHLYFLDIFKWNLKMNLLLYKCPHFLEINGSNMLQHSGDHRKLLIFAQGTIFHTCGGVSGYATGKKSIQHSFRVACQPMKATKFIHLAFLLHSPQLLKPDTNLFGHSPQLVQKQLLTQCSFMTFTIVNLFYDFPVSQRFLKLIGKLNIND